MTILLDFYTTTPCAPLKRLAVAVAARYPRTGKRSVMWRRSTVAMGLLAITLCKGVRDAVPIRQ